MQMLKIIRSSEGSVVLFSSVRGTVPPMNLTTPMPLHAGHMRSAQLAAAAQVQWMGELFSIQTYIDFFSQYNFIYCVLNKIHFFVHVIGLYIVPYSLYN